MSCCRGCGSGKKHVKVRKTNPEDEEGIYKPAEDNDNQDTKQPFHVPSAFKPISVDSPALESVRASAKKPIIKAQQFDKPNSSTTLEPQSVPLSSRRDGNSTQKVVRLHTEKKSINDTRDDEECGSSISSRSISLNRLSQFQDFEEAQHLLDEDEDEDSISILHQIGTLVKRFPTTFDDEEENKNMDLTPRASPLPFNQKSELFPDFENPPALPAFPPPESSESEFSFSQSSSRSVSCSRERGMFGSNRNNENGGYSLSLVDMSSIRYADSASSSFCSDNDYQNISSRGPSRSRDPNYFQAEFGPTSITTTNSSTTPNRSIPTFRPCNYADACTSTEFYKFDLNESPATCVQTNNQIDEEKDESDSRSSTPTPTHPVMKSSSIKIVLKQPTIYSSVDQIRSRAKPQGILKPSSGSYPVPAKHKEQPTSAPNAYDSVYNEFDQASLVSSSRSIGSHFQPSLHKIEEIEPSVMRGRTQSEGIFKSRSNPQPNTFGSDSQLVGKTKVKCTEPLQQETKPLIDNSGSLENNNETDTSWVTSSLSSVFYEEQNKTVLEPLGPPQQSPNDNKESSGTALDLASQSNVQDAFVIAVEQQARERLEKLSALKRIKPVDMTKLSHQLSEVPSAGGDTSELNGLIEATGSPIYVTSASELSSSQSALYRTTGTIGGGGGESTDRSPPRNVSPNNNVTVVGVNSTIYNHIPPTQEEELEQGNIVAKSQVKRALPNGQYPDTVNRSSSSRDSKSSGKGSQENLGDSRESIEVEGAKSPSSRGPGSKLNSSRESIPESSTQYANMINMVEWDNGPHREMAVDVPSTFIPRNKTPPRYPPNRSSTLNANNNNKPVVAKIASGGVVLGDGVGVRGANGNGAVSKPIPPPRIGDKDWSGVNNNNTQVPNVHPRTVVSPKTSAAAATTTPSRDEAERIRKYQEELKKRREQEEKHAKEQEFLRTSLRGSKKLQALESIRQESPVLVAGFVNNAYDVDEERIACPQSQFDATLQKPVGLTDLVESLQRVQQTLKKNGLHLDETVSAVGSLMQTPGFQQILNVHNKVQDVWCFNAPPSPFSAHAIQLVQECLGSLYNCSVPESNELVEILSRVNIEGVLYAHDKIAERERLLMTNDSPLNAGESVDVDHYVPSAVNTSTQVSVINPQKSSVRTAYVPETQPDDRIKVVRIEKTQDPLGATVRNEADAVVIGRIVKGGVAERSGLLHEGDEILEVNGLEMRGKSVNEVCDILHKLVGTLTFLIVPAQSPATIQQRRDVLLHVRAHFDYDPEDDIYVPCRELGIAFNKGDVLHVINQDDPNWWQAHREGEEDQTLAGLIPSKSFQEQREAVKQQLLGETETREKSKKGTLLCAKSQKKKKKKIPYSSAFTDDFDADEIPTYEEVALYYPRTSFKRPVVLIGPPNIGRHELRQRLMQESERFAAAVPHTSRTKKEGEIDGADYHFISRAQFESDILQRKFVEHGEFEKAYYGTSLDAIRSVVNIGKICVLNLHPQSLKMLRNSDIKPYIVFVAPPPLERLRQMRHARGEAYKEEELIDIIEKAREMDEKYGHYFDLVIINNDIERTYHELLQRINYTEREPQWVPSFWLKQ